MSMGLMSQDYFDREFERGRQDMLLAVQRQQAAERQQVWRRRRLRLLLLLVVVTLLAAAVGWSVRSDHLVVRATNGHLALTVCFAHACSYTPAAPARGALHHLGAARAVVANPESGVHVCAPQHFKRALLACTQGIARFALRHLGVIHLSATGLHGADFTTARLTVNVASKAPAKGANGAGGTGRATRFKHLARIDVPGGVSHDVWAVTLKKLFHAAHVSAQAGRTYRIRVSEGSEGRTLLGTVRFTIVR